VYLCNTRDIDIEKTNRRRTSVLTLFMESPLISDSSAAISASDMAALAPGDRWVNRGEEEGEPLGGL